MRSLNLIAHKYIHEDGYGRYGMELIRALAALGVNVYPAMEDDLNLPSWMQRMRGLDFTRPTLSLMPGHNFYALPGLQWGYSMWEDNSLPKGWVENINKTLRLLMVPCPHNAEVFKRKGVKVPIHVVPGGTSPQEFPLLPPVCHDRPYTFLVLGDRQERKGIDIVLGAFARAFETEKDVRLIIKTRAVGILNGVFLNFLDQRISVWQDDLPSMNDVYAQIDCFAYPSHGEGWGMPPREAAMMGVPVIATRWSGLEVGIDHWAIPINTFTMQDSPLSSVRGQWARPDIAEVAEKMRWCYENRDAARAIGQRAARWLRENQTWEHTARAIMQLYKEYMIWH